ncbi:MAG: DUF2301 domain-containing membrane protein [Nitrospirota bacterium]
MEESYTLERAIAEAGIHYPRSYDIAYRIGYPIQLLGILYLTLAFIFAFPYMVAGVFIFESGVVLSSIFLLVWKREIKRFILMATFAGILLQAVSYIVVPEPYLRTLFIIGVGLVCVGGAGLVGKEAYCFGFGEGWLILLLYPVIIFINLIGVENRVILSTLYISLLLLHVLFLRKKLSQPLLKK